MEAAKKWQKAIMAISYRCYLLDIDRIVADFAIERDNDAAALLVAGRVLEALPCTAVEIWNCRRRSQRLAREAQPPECQRAIAAAPPLIRVPAHQQRAESD